MGGAMTKVEEGGQEPIDEDQLVFRPGTRGPTTGTRGETSLVPLVPQRADLGDEFGDHSRLQPRDPLASRDRCTYPAPHHTGHDPRSRPQRATPTMHELVRAVPQRSRLRVRSGLRIW